MSHPDLDVSALRDALPVSVAVRLSDDELRAGLDQARVLLGPDASTVAVQGAAWLLAHAPEQRREQVDHMLQIATLRREHLLQAEGHLGGAFRVEPDLDDAARNITIEENLADLDRAESLLGVLTARTGGRLTVTHQEMNDTPPFAIEPTADGLRVTTFESEGLDLGLSIEEKDDPAP
jgi:hypothetical protein